MCNRRKERVTRINVLEEVLEVVRSGGNKSKRKGKWDEVEGK